MSVQKSKSILERFLSLFTEVRPGEGSNALLLMLNIFLILTSYYIMKPVREALILSGGFGELSGAVVKSLTSAGQVLLLMGAVPLYAKIANRFPRRKLINSVTVFFVACLGVFYLLALVNVPLGVIFFLWIGIFNLMVPAQFWAFSNDIYSPGAGKRIFVIIAFGASAGAVLGGIITDLLIEPLGIYQLLLVAGSILLLSLILTNIVDSRAKGKPGRRPLLDIQNEEKLTDKRGAFRLVFNNRYLLMIAFLMLFLNWVNTTGEYILGQTVENSAKSEASSSEVERKAHEAAAEDLGLKQSEYNNLNPVPPDGPTENIKQRELDNLVEEYKDNYIKQYIGSFYARFFTIVNLAALLTQLFLVSRILKYLGVRVALLFLPIIALSGYFIIVFYPVLSIIRWAKTAENSTDYSLQNTVRQVLFLPTTREEKYKAKQAIDTFFWRAGDLLSALVVLVGTTLLAFQVKHFALFNILLVSVWLILVIFIGAENKKMTEKSSSS